MGIKRLGNKTMPAISGIRPMGGALIQRTLLATTVAPDSEFLLGV